MVWDEKFLTHMNFWRLLSFNTWREVRRRSGDERVFLLFCFHCSPVLSRCYQVLLPLPLLLLVLWALLLASSMVTLLAFLSSRFFLLCSRVTRAQRNQWQPSGISPARDERGDKSRWTADCTHSEDSRLKTHTCNWQLASHTDWIHKYRLGKKEEKISNGWPKAGPQWQWKLRREQRPMALAVLSFRGQFICPVVLLFFAQAPSAQCPALPCLCC